MSHGTTVSRDMGAEWLALTTIRELTIAALTSPLLVEYRTPFEGAADEAHHPVSGRQSARYRPACPRPRGAGDPGGAGAQRLPRPLRARDPMGGRANRLAPRATQAQAD